MTLTIVYDNYTHTEGLRTDWGFSCLVESGDKSVLFDTGGNGSILLHNMHKLGLDPQTIDAVVLSHVHGDHTGGLAGLLESGAHPPVYIPANFPTSFQDELSRRAEVVQVPGPMELFPGIYSTGGLGSSIIEQALVVQTSQGFVVITGCAHPGIVHMVQRAKTSLGGEIALAMGGFHLREHSESQLRSIAGQLRELGVGQVAPCHCSGDQTRRVFAEEYGEDFLLVGVGKVVTIP